MSVAAKEIHDWLNKIAKLNDAVLNRASGKNIELHWQMMKTQKSIESIRRMLDQLRDDKNPADSTAPNTLKAIPFPTTSN